MPSCSKSCVAEWQTPVKLVKDGTRAQVRFVPPRVSDQDDIPVMLIDEATVEPEG